MSNTESLRGVVPTGPVTAPRADNRTAEPFESFYERNYQPMVALAFAMVDTTEQAEEVTQDAFAAMFRRYGSLDNAEAYLRSCVVNGCRSVQRRRALVRRKPLPRPDVATVDEHDHLIDAVGRLPAKQRAVIVLRYHEGLGEAEIARTLGMAVGSVKSTLSRARARLREELREELEP